MALSCQTQLFEVYELLPGKKKTNKMNFNNSVLQQYNDLNRTVFSPIFEERENQPFAMLNG